MGQNDLIYDTFGSAFTQLDPTEAFDWLTCVGVGDIAIPQGDSTPVYKPDPLRAGKMLLWDLTEGAPGMPTTRLTKPLNNVYNFLLEAKCRFQFRINWICAGERSSVTNYKIAKVLLGGRMKTKGISAPVKPAGNDAVGKVVDTTADVEGLGAALVYPLKSARLTLASTTDVADVVFLPEQCASTCRAAVGLGEIGYALVEAALYSGIQKTVTYGGAWNATANTPFAISGNDASSGLTIETVNGYRLLIGGSVADPLMPPEVSYLDVTAATNPTDAGLTWTNVYVGAVVNLGINMLRRNGAGRIWAAMTGGYLAYNDTQGTGTWTVINTGAAQTFRDLVFLDDRQGFAVGDANTFYVTTDGVTWNASTGPAGGVNLLSIDANRFGYLFVTTNDARMFRSIDDGQNWEEILDLSVGTMPRIRFDPDNLYFGALLYNTATPTGHFYRSEDGGASWLEWTSPTGGNSGYNGLFVCDPNLIYVGGNAHGGLSYVAKFDRQAS